MSACFYDRRALAGMVGLDKHVFWERFDGHWTGLVIGLPDPDHKHVVGCLNIWTNNGNHTTTVTSEGHQMMKKDFSFTFVPHVPIKLPKISILGAVWLAGVIYSSESKPFLAKGNVTGQGGPLACCVGWVVGFNLNCEGRGVVVNPNTVITLPSLADFADAIVPFVIGALVDGLVDGILPDWGPGFYDKKGEKVPYLKEVLKFIFDKYAKDHVVEFATEKTKQAAEAVESFVDGL